MQNVETFEAVFDSLSKENKEGTCKYLPVAKFDDFWSFWKENKEAIKSKGYWISKNKSDFWIFKRTVNTTPSTSDVELPQISIDDLPDVSNLKFLKAHQIEHARFVIGGLERQNYYLDTSGTGSGKTFIALGAVKHFGVKTLALVPAAVVRDWEQAAKLVKVDHLVEVVSLEKARNGSTLIKRTEDKDPRFIFPPVEDYPMIIFDEVHKCGGQGTLQSRLLIDSANKDRKILMLSATAADSPLKMRGLGFILDLFDQNTYHCWLNWAFKHGVVKGRFGLEFVKPFLFKSVFPQINLVKSHRIPQSLLLESFPAGQTIAESVVGDPKFLKEYKDALHIYIKRTKEQIKADCEGSLLAAQLRARQASELAKIKPTIDMIEDLLLEGKSVVVFLNFLDSLKIIKEHFQKNNIEYRLSDGTLTNGKIPLAEIIGGQNSAERQKAKDDFQEDKVRLILVTLQAGGTGISLHDLNGNYPRASIISPSFNAVDLKQALGRIYRTGGKTPVVQKILFLQDTIEEAVCKKLQKKLDAIDSFNDGDINPALFNSEVTV